ncbi:MAG TPA: TIGR00730 family Rossman fold protein [Salinisphaeraceae bacterium]|nr:TIGR00730 family Rossman fold protein [Salinisphaeraceae bacterium]
MRICVYCASSRLPDPIYREVAFHMGELLAEGGHTLIYGGGGTGSMGAIADGALSRNGEVFGIMPRFLAERELSHQRLTKLELVANMRERKHKMLDKSDAVLALPGGCGTLEELLETITLRRLGQYQNPIILLNTLDFYQPFQTMMAHVVAERFMAEGKTVLWQLVDRPEEVLPAIAEATAISP